MRINERLADQRLAEKSGQCWSSPQEMASAKPGDFPHGLVDECHDQSGEFRRVWNDRAAVWLNAE